MRELGKSLPETGYKLSKVKIYRACEDLQFKPKDYVTLSLKFAIGHAEHQAAVNEEPYSVIEATVNASDVFEAYNPGEYFYNGPLIKGKIVKTVRALSKRMLSKKANFSSVYHGTDKKSADDIIKNGISMNKSHKGYFGRAFYVADNASLAKSNYADFADDDNAPGVVLEFKISSNARIWDLRKSDDFDKYKSSGLEKQRHKDDFHSIAMKSGCDGIYDSSMGGLAIYNPKILNFVKII